MRLLSAAIFSGCPPNQSSDHVFQKLQILGARVFAVDDRFVQKGRREGIEADAFPLCVVVTNTLAERKPNVILRMRLCYRCALCRR